MWLLNTSHYYWCVHTTKKMTKLHYFFRCGLLSKIAHLLWAEEFQFMSMSGKSWKTFPAKLSQDQEVVSSRPLKKCTGLQPLKMRLFWCFFVHLASVLYPDFGFALKNYGTLIKRLSLGLGTSMINLQVRRWLHYHA